MTYRKQCKYIAGGTIDITAHEVLHGGGLREIHQASGGDWGGSSVNKQFLDYMTSHVFGQDVIEVIKQKHPADWLEFQNNFERKKCTYNAKIDSKVTLRLPASFSDAFEEKNGTTIRTKLENADICSQISCLKDKIRLSTDLFKSFFDRSIENIHRKVKHVLDKLPDIKSILVVGGFAECKLLTESIRNAFENHIVLLPEDPSLAVLKGAVIFGFSPNTIRSRVCRYTYGIAKQRKFIEGRDPEEKRRYENGKFFCDDVFDKHVERGSIIEIGQFQDEKEYRTVRKDQRMVYLELYASTDKNPNFTTDESCHCIGFLEIDLRDEEDVGVVFVKINVSGTELEVEATVKPSGRIVSTTCNFLG